jgi:hypothetical protein
MKTYQDYLNQDCPEFKLEGSNVHYLLLDHEVSPCGEYSGMVTMQEDGQYVVVLSVEGEIVRVIRLHRDKKDPVLEGMQYVHNFVNQEL